MWKDLWQSCLRGGVIAPVVEPEKCEFSMNKPWRWLCSWTGPHREISSVLPEGRSVGPSGGAVKMGPRVRVQLPDCSPQGGSDTLYSAVLTCEGHACMCSSVGSLNRLPVRVKLSRNLKLIWRGPHIRVCVWAFGQQMCAHALHPTVYVCFTLTCMDTRTVDTLAHLEA